MELIRSFLSPQYHYRKIKEDLAAARLAFSIWHLNDLRHRPDELQTAIRGKLFATFVVSGMVAALAFPIAAGIQAYFASYFAGLVATIVAGHTIANISFVLVWFNTNRDFYGPGRPGDLFHDILPILWKVLLITSGFIAIGLPFNLIAVEALEHWAPQAVRILPIGVFALIIDAALFNSTFVRVMGNLFERYSVVLAARYAQLAPQPSESQHQ